MGWGPLTDKRHVVRMEGGQVGLMVRPQIRFDVLHCSVHRSGRHPGPFSASSVSQLAFGVAPPSLLCRLSHECPMIVIAVLC